MKLPEEHRNWTHHVSQECIEIEILELAKLAASGKKVIVDTNIPPDATLKNFSSWALYHLPVEIDCNHTGFFTYTRSDFEKDTREEVSKNIKLENKNKIQRLVFCLIDNNTIESRTFEIIVLLSFFDRFIS